MVPFRIRYTSIHDNMVSSKVPAEWYLCTRNVYNVNRSDHGTITWLNDHFVYQDVWSVYRFYCGVRMYGFRINFRFLMFFILFYFFYRYGLASEIKAEKNGGGGVCIIRCLEIEIKTTPGHVLRALNSIIMHI